MQSFDFCPYLPDYENDVCEEVCESNDLSSWMISAPAADSGATPVADGATPTAEDPADRELYERLAYDQPGGTAPHVADNLDHAKASLHTAEELIEEYIKAAGERPVDHWDLSEASSPIRVHAKKRKALFTPTGVKGTPDLSTLSDDRTTYVKYDDGEVVEIADN